MNPARNEHDATPDPVSRGDRDAGARTNAHDGGGFGPAFGPDFAAFVEIERALANALLRASRDGQHELVRLLVEEIRARRLERASACAGNVVSLDDWRRGR